MGMIFKWMMMGYYVFRVDAMYLIGRIFGRRYYLKLTKMYQDMKQQFWWNGMKKDISQFVARCLKFQKVKAEHMCPEGLLQPLSIP
jgi:hypothetical protein